MTARPRRTNPKKEDPAQPSQYGYYWMRKLSSREFHFGQVIDTCLPGGLTQVLWMIPTLSGSHTIERLLPDELLPAPSEVGAVVMELLSRTSDRRRKDRIFDALMSRVVECWFDEHNAGRHKELSVERNVAVIVDATEQIVAAVPNNQKRPMRILLERTKNCRDRSRVTRSGDSVGIQ